MHSISKLQEVANKATVATKVHFKSLATAGAVLRVADVRRLRLRGYGGWAVHALGALPRAAAMVLLVAQLVLRVALAHRVAHLEQLRACPLH